MKVYCLGASKNQRLFVSPGRDFPAGHESWFDVDGKSPLLINVHFVNGVADVPDQLANYLIDKNYASKRKVSHLEAA